ncbi:hypothetical protein VMCG_01320 [Cytospora schulzeri]|uniref:Uncharacterized protein n=1 Tax=Cytospora schulzeri TaxID=448051 RepID=A0A423X5Z3_9PEZI|nr:hypothetical protein VMCG_01320 [Valsa malicola]
MKKRTNISRLPRASALLLFLTAIPTTSALFGRHVSPSELFGRASTCGDSSYTQCNQGLPDEFCCPSGESCIVLAGSTTALCCPSGGDCSEIEPIPCELSLEDKSQHPDNVVMTTALAGTLATCGDACCPFGYSCNSAGNCDMDADQSKKPVTGSVTSSATTSKSTGTSSETIGVTTASDAAATGTADSSGSDKGSATATSGSSASSTDSAAADSTGSGSDSSSSSGGSSSGPSAAIVAGGVVGGIAGAMILGMLVWFFVKKELKRKDAAKGEKDPGRSSRSSSFGNITTSPRGPNGGPPVISKPIVSEEGTLRSDFGRKVSPHAGSFGDAGDEEEEYEKEFGTVGAPVGQEDIPGVYSVPYSPPRITTPRAVSSMYAAYDYSNEDNDAYQPPVKMPSARHYGGQDNRVSVGAEARDALGSPISDYGGQRITRDPNAGYIDVFADTDSLAPPRHNAGDRLTSFTDLMEGAELGPQGRGEPYLGRNQ